MTTHLFVYGTLLENVQTEMSTYLAKNAFMLGKGYILGKLYRVSWFPGAISSQEVKDKVFGCVYAITAKNIEAVLSTLDVYEGVDATSDANSLFVRNEVTVYLNNGSTCFAWVYFYNKSTAALEHIVSGNFLEG